MSSKRGTNNSVVSTLEEQNDVLSDTLKKGGLPVGTSDTIAVEKVEKSKPQKKKLVKSKTSSSSSSSSQGSSRGRSGDPGANVTNSALAAAIQGAAAPVTVVTPATQDPLPGDLPGDGVSPASSGDTGQSEDLDSQQGQRQGEGEFEGEELSLQQQQWMWQAQFQPFGFSPFGNFVPNFSLGSVPVPDWAKPDQTDQAPDPPVRQVHSISDDDDDESVGGPTGVADQVQEINTPTSSGGSGNLAGLVKEQMAQVKEADRVTDKVEPGVAELLQRYLADAHQVAEMERLTKRYPRVANVEGMKVPRIDAEVFQGLDPVLKNSDQAFQTIQKGILGAMSAFAPILDLAFKRADKDQDLDSLAQNFLDGCQLLAFAHNNISSRRRELLKPHLSPTYAKAMTKGQVASQEWLYGGDLLETTKTCEAARRISDKVIKRKIHMKGRGGQQQQKRFRNPFPVPTQPMLRAFNPYQMQQQFRFPSPQMFPNPTFQALPNYGTFGNGFSFNYPRRFRNQGPRQKGFVKRGGYNK